jgi:hypothetical protein
LHFATWRVLLEDIELMPQYQDFGFEPRRGLKQSHSIQTKRKAIGIINRNHGLIRLPPSPPADGVFGSDTWLL